MSDRGSAFRTDGPYEQWIIDNWTDALGTCAEQTTKMAERFPELKRIRGHYMCPIWGEREHWWLVTPSGAVIDPTREQFPSGGRGVYVPWDEHAEEPIGKCANCGGYSYESKGGNNTVCGDACARSYCVYMGVGYAG